MGYESKWSGAFGSEMKNLSSTYQKDPYNFFEMKSDEEIAKWYLSTLAPEMQNQANFDTILKTLEETGGPNVALDFQDVEDTKRVLETSNRKIQDTLGTAFNTEGKGKLLKGGSEIRRDRRAVEVANQTAADIGAQYGSSIYGLKSDEVKDVNTWFAEKVAGNMITNTQALEDKVAEVPWYLRGSEYGEDELASGTGVDQFTEDFSFKNLPIPSFSKGPDDKLQFGFYQGRPGAKKASERLIGGLSDTMGLDTAGDWFSDRWKGFKKWIRNT